MKKMETCYCIGVLVLAVIFLSISGCATVKYFQEPTSGGKVSIVGYNCSIFNTRVNGIKTLRDNFKVPFGQEAHIAYMAKHYVPGGYRHVEYETNYTPEKPGDSLNITVTYESTKFKSSMKLDGGIIQ